MKKILIVLVLLLGTLNAFSSEMRDGLSVFLDFPGLTFFITAASTFIIVLTTIFLFKGILFFNRYLKINVIEIYYYVNEELDFREIQPAQLETGDYYLKLHVLNKTYVVKQKNNYEFKNKIFYSRNEGLEYIRTLMKTKNSL